MPTNENGQFEYPEKDWAVGAMRKVEQSAMTDADNAMGLSKEEKFLYQHHLDNLWSGGRVSNPDGSISTVNQITAKIGDKYYNLPTVWGGRVKDTDAAIARARGAGLNKFPSYKTEAEAEARYQQMHGYMDRDVQEYQKAQATPSAPIGAKWGQLPRSQKVEDTRGQPVEPYREGERRATDPMDYWNPKQASWPYDKAQRALGMEKLRSMDKRRGIR